MELQEAIETLQFLVETEDEKEALASLVVAAQKGLLADKISYKQAKFANAMLEANGTDYDSFRLSFDNDWPDEIMQLSKNQAKNLINQLISLGYRDKLK